MVFKTYPANGWRFSDVFRGYKNGTLAMDMDQAKTILNSEKTNRKIGFAIPVLTKGKLKFIFFVVEFKDDESEYLNASQK